MYSGATIKHTFLGLILMLYLSLAAHSPPLLANDLPPLKPLGEPLPGAPGALQEVRRPPSLESTTPHVPLPAAPVSLPGAGETDSYGIQVNSDLEAAYHAAYLGGDGRAALEALARLDRSVQENRGRWLISALRAQVLLGMGRAADAEIELEETEKREIEYTGSNLYARALRGEVRLWLADYAGAIRDLGQVAEAIGGWRMPTEFSSPPERLDLLVAVNTARLRTYTGLAGAYLLSGDPKSAVPWAEEAEKGFNDVQYVSVRYGPYVQLFAESYYGRASNLAFLAAARMETTMAAARIVPADGPKGWDALFQEVSAFYGANGYPAGQITAEALRARALMDLGRFEESEPLARAAAERAATEGMSDLVWRVEALRGKSLVAQGRKREAEEAFRRAQAAIEAVSGSLSSDRAKLRFGVGKEEVTYYLASLDAEKKDYGSLFGDLERGRARAFVDMLAGRALPKGREVGAITEIRDLDQQILELCLRNSTPGSPPGSKEKEAKLRHLRQERLKALQARDPELVQALSVSHEELPLVQGRLLKGEAMAYFLPARPDDSLRILLITRDSVRLESLAATAGKVDLQLKTFRSAIRRRDAQAQEAAAKSLSDSLKLSGWGAVTAAYVVPSGKLHFVPWGALDATFPISVLPTGSWLNRPGSLVATHKKASILGDPALGGELPRLLEARAEAQALGQLYHTSPLLGNQATEVSLRADVGTGVEVLHLATHATFNPDDPLLSAVFLSNGSRPAPLTAARLYESPLPARLVVLSGCETGLGQVAAGEDLLGLIRSFYLGGALTLLSSQWLVEDRGARLFMETFHQQAARGDYGLAWLKTRDQLRKQGFPPSVYGAFVLGGALR